MNTKMFAELLEKRLSRREFLTYVGAAVVAMTGIHAFLKTLNLTSSKTKLGDYNGGVYGGGKKRLG